MYEDNAAPEVERVMSVVREEERMVDAKKRGVSNEDIHQDESLEMRQKYHARIPVDRQADHGAEQDGAYRA